MNTCCFFSQMHFQTKRNEGRIISKETQITKKKQKIMEVECFPVASILFALNVTTVDYFSLDVEGAELQVLKTIPFGLFDIKVLTVEFAHTFEGKIALKSFMESKGYKTVMEIHPTKDFLFVKL